MEDPENYYDTYKDTQGCKRTFWILVILGIMIILCSYLDAQQWKNENKGLYPNAVSLTLNRHNYALGLKYDYLFQEPVLNIPFGLSASFSQTIKPDLDYNSYEWERKYCIGSIITLGHLLENGLTHFMVTTDLVYNSHPRPWPEENLQPGQSYAKIEETTNIGCNLGLRIQMQHATMFFHSDIVNWMSYTEFGVGYTFSFYKTR
jgi:hypothetical protein